MSLILFIATLTYVALWVLHITKVRSNSINFIEFIIKFIFLVPFWLFFMYKVFHIFMPTLPELYSNDILRQNIKITNNTDKTITYSFFYNQKSELHPAYPLYNVRLLNKVSIFEGKEKNLSFLCQPELTKSIYLEYFDEMDSSVHSLILDVLKEDTSINSTDFKPFTLKKSIDFSQLWQEGIMFIIAIIGVWYHYLMTVRKKLKVFLLIVTLVITIVGLAQLFLNSMLIYGYELDFMTSII